MAVPWLAVHTGPMSPVRRDLKVLIGLAVPVVGTRLGVMAMGLADTVVVGRWSATELGYIALGLAPAGVVLVSAMGLLSGVPVMAARRLGEGRAEEAGFVLRRGLAYGLWTGLAATVLLYAVGPLFLMSLGLEPGLAAGAGAAGLRPVHGVRARRRGVFLLA